MTTEKVPGYILRFRCVNCGKQELRANYLSGELLAEDKIRARIYQVICSSCGWRGNACGVSATHISHTTELRVRLVAQGK